MKNFRLYACLLTLCAACLSATIAYAAVRFKNPAHKVDVSIDASIDKIDKKIQAIETELERQRELLEITAPQDTLSLTQSYDVRSQDIDANTNAQADYADDADSVGVEGIVEDNSKKSKSPTSPQALLAKVAPKQPVYKIENNAYVDEFNNAEWHYGMRVNPMVTVKLQVLLDWNNASPGPIDTQWGMNSKKALRGFEYMHGLDVDGLMDDLVWQKLNQSKFANRPILVGYRITEADVKGPYSLTPYGYAAKSKMKRLNYQSIYEMLAERFHMHVDFLRKLNPRSRFKAGDDIIVINVGNYNTTPIQRVIADKKSEVLYAYGEDGNLVATYPTTVGSLKTPSPNGTHSVVSKVHMPYYMATSKSKPKKKWTLPPGPNNPVGIVWLSLSKPSYGIHGSPKPEGISRQASAGCVRLTNWDAAELYATIKKGAQVEFR